MTAPPLVRRALPDPGPIRAFLDPGHTALVERLPELADLAASVEEPADDADARAGASRLLALMGGGGWYDPIRRQDLRGCCLIREALGAVSPLADAVFALQALGTTPLLLAGTEDQRARWVPEALAGRAMAAFAMTEPEAGSDVASLRTRAEPTDDGFVINGAKTFISNAGLADFYVLFASTAPDRGTRGITCFLVPADTPGLTFTGPQVMSAPHPLGELELRDCRVGADQVVGAVDGGFKVGMATLDRLRPTVGAAACGMASRALEEALSHATTRSQFGQVLAEFQIIQEKLGRMFTDLVASRLLVYRAAFEKDQGADRISVEAATAKAFATEAAQRIVDESVQILGGRGVLACHPVDRLYRSVRALRIYEGTTEIQRTIIARALVASRAGSEPT